MRAECEVCHVVRNHVAKNRKTGRKICRYCYRDSRKESCGLCLRVRWVAQRRVDGSAVCHGCATARRKEQCVRCGNLRSVCARNALGNPLCSYCAMPRWRCHDCQRVRPVYQHKLSKRRICASCRQARRSGRCPSCQEPDKRLLRKNSAGELICVACALNPRRDRRPPPCAPLS